MTNELPKDRLISAKRVTEKKDSKGRDLIIVSLSKEEAALMLESAAAGVTERGLNLQMHIGDKETSDGSRSFRSCFMFVKGIQEPPAGGFQQRPQSSAPAAKAQSNVDDKLAALRKGRNG